MGALEEGFSSFSAPGAAAAGGSALLGGAGGMGALAAAGPAGIAVGVASMILGGIQASAAARAKKKADQRAELGDMNKTAYNKALDEYYQRKQNSEKRMALENYNQFNTMEQIAPGYKDVYKPGAVGAAPDARNYIAGNNKKTNAANYTKMSLDAKLGSGSVTLPGG